MGVKNKMEKEDYEENCNICGLDKDIKDIKHKDINQKGRDKLHEQAIILFGENYCYRDEPEYLAECDMALCSDCYSRYKTKKMEDKMETEEAKNILSDIINEHNVDGSRRPIGVGITSGQWINDKLWELYNEYFREGPAEEVWTRKDVWSAEKIDDLLFRLSTRAKQTMDYISKEDISKEDVSDILKMIWILLEIYRPEITKTINQ